MTILVTGATAHFGRQAVETLAAHGHDVRALSRDPRKAGLAAGAHVVAGDLTRPETLTPAMAGVEAMFVVLPYPMDPAPLLETATTAGVRRIVFLSSGAVVDHTATQPDVIAAYHHGVEQAVIATGIGHTFLRIFFPAVNSLAFAAHLAYGNVIRVPYPEAASAPIHESDVAEAAMRVLTEDGHSGRVYDLTGPQSLTQADQVGILADVLERPLTIEAVDPVSARVRMARFLDAEFAGALLDLMAQTVGKHAQVNTLVEQITGRPARTYEQWAADHAKAFRR